MLGLARPLLNLATDDGVVKVAKFSRDVGDRPAPAEVRHKNRDPNPRAEARGEGTARCRRGGGRRAVNGSPGRWGWRP